MILVWRGWGLLGVAALFLPLASCAGLMDTRPGLALLLGGLALAGGGVACWVCGRRWNRPATEHSLFFIPLQYWGLAYVLAGVFFTLGGVAGLIRKGV